MKWLLGIAVLIALVVVTTLGGAPDCFSHTTSEEIIACAADLDPTEDFK